MAGVSNAFDYDQQVTRNFALSPQHDLDHYNNGLDRTDVRQAPFGDSAIEGSTDLTSSLPESSGRDLTRVLAASEGTCRLPSNPSEQAPVNWLPFGSAGFDTTSTSVHLYGSEARTHPSFEVPTPITLPNDDEIVADVAISRNPIEVANVQNDHLSVLIASMLANSPGVDVDISSGNGENSYRARLYADGAGARSSQSDRRSTYRPTATQVAASHNTVQTSSSSALRESLSKKVNARLAAQQLTPKLTPEVHKELTAEASETLNKYLRPHEQLSGVDSLAAIETWEYLIQLYFDHFHPVYPFLDHLLLSLPKWGWALCLATASLGARYVGLRDLITYGELLSKTCHEILLRDVSLLPCLCACADIEARNVPSGGLLAIHTSQVTLRCQPLS